jgi:hypothetical protein
MKKSLLTSQKCTSTEQLGSTTGGKLFRFKKIYAHWGQFYMKRPLDQTSNNIVNDNHSHHHLGETSSFIAPQMSYLHQNKTLFLPIICGFTRDL